MLFKHTTLEIDAQIATLTLDHQEVLNAVAASKKQIGGLFGAIKRFQRENPVPIDPPKDVN